MPSLKNDAENSSCIPEEKKHKQMPNSSPAADEQDCMAAFLREHPHLQQASPAWQKFYYRIRASIHNK